MAELDWWAMDGELVRVQVEGARALTEGETTTFSLRVGGFDEPAFILRFQGRLYAYLNRCPHWNIDLDMGDERFFDKKLGQIYCKTHGARFEPREGECIAGPCFGQSLVPLQVVDWGEEIWVHYSPDVTVG